MFKQTIYFIFRGFVLSIPAGFLIWIGYRIDQEPHSWICFGVVLVLGLPWNVFALAGFYGLLVLYAKVIEFFHIPQDAQFNGFALLFFCVVAAGLVGAHINGVLITCLSGNEKKHREKSQHRSNIES
jgi:hypothetical protein